MVNEIKALIKQIEVFDTLNNYKIEFGLLNDSHLPAEVSILNTDDTVTKITMTLGEVMYFTEFGTMTIPPRPILKQCVLWANEVINKFIDEAFIGVFEKGWTKKTIEQKLKKLSIPIEDYIKNQIEIMLISNATLSNILHVKDENKYLYDLRKLKNHIHCKITKK